MKKGEAMDPEFALLEVGIQRWEVIRRNGTSWKPYLPAVEGYSKACELVALLNSGQVS